MILIEVYITSVSITTLFLLLTNLLDTLNTGKSEIVGKDFAGQEKTIRKIFWYYKIFESYIISYLRSFQNLSVSPIFSIILALEYFPTTLHSKLNSPISQALNEYKRSQFFMPLGKSFFRHDHLHWWLCSGTR